MKARPYKPKSDAVLQAIECEMLKREPAIRIDTAQQLTAVFLYTLDRVEGYKTKRLKRIFEAVNDMFNHMDSFGKEFDAVDVIGWCKKVHGIDLEKDITIELEVKNK